MGYTRKQILEQCEKAFTDKDVFYKNKFINYRGKTTDTKDYFTEIVAEFLCENINEYISGITKISRRLSYKTEGHEGKYSQDSNREEEKIAMDIFCQSKESGELDYIGKIEDYQVPLKSKADDVAGKIDLLSCDGNTMRILELKKPDSNETMLRCVLEGFTYLKTVDKDKLLTDFGYEPEKVTVKASPFVFKFGNQYKEMLEKRSNLQKLMELLDSKPYYIIKKDDYIVTEE